MKKLLTMAGALATLAAGAYAYAAYSSAQEADGPRREAIGIHQPTVGTLTLDNGSQRAEAPLRETEYVSVTDMWNDRTGRYDLALGNDLGDGPFQATVGTGSERANIFITGVDWEQGTYEWYFTPGAEYVYSARISSDYPCRVFPFIGHMANSSIYLDDNLGYRLNEADDEGFATAGEADFSLVFKNTEDLSNVLFIGFQIVGNPGVTATLTDISLICRVPKVEAEAQAGDDADLELPGMYPDSGTTVYPVALADGVTKLALINTGGDYTYAVGMNTTAGEVWLPSTVEIDGQVRKLKYFGSDSLSPSFDWSGAESVTKIHFPKNIERIMAGFTSTNVNEIWLEKGDIFRDYAISDDHTVDLHLPYNLSRRTYDGYDGVGRTYIGEEDATYPQTNYSDYVIKDSEGNFFGVQTVDSRCCIREIFTQAEEVTIPATVPAYGGTRTVQQVGNDGSGNYVGNLAVQSGALKRIRVPETVSQVRVYWSACNVREWHLASQPSTYWRINDSFELYVPADLVDAFKGDYNWNEAFIAPEGWAPEWVVVDVAKPGEFGDTYLTQNGFSWENSYYVKVTGNIGLTDLGQMKNLTNLRKLDLSETTVTELPASFMASKRTLTDVVLPATMETVGNDAFQNCVKLTHIDLGGTKTIGNYAFNVCSALDFVDTSSVTAIGECAFGSCSRLEWVDLTNVKTIGHLGFSDCTSLTGIDLSGVETVMPYAFSNCRSLLTADLASATLVYDAAFYGCNRLTSVSIPLIEHVYSHVFAECSSLTDVTFNPNLLSVGQQSFYNCRSLKKAILPASVFTVNTYAFYGCSRLEEIDLGAKIQTIGYGAFSNCNLRKVTCRAAVPPSANGEFLEGIDVTQAFLYVPAFSRDYYRNNYYWAQFFIMRPIDGAIDYIIVDRPLAINLEEEDNANVAGNPTIELTWSKNSGTYRGQLTAAGEGTLSAGEMRISSYWNSANVTNSSNLFPTLINHAGKMRADRVLHTMKFYALNQWHAVSLPYDVKVSEIIPGADTYWAIREYDCAARAQGLPAWRALTADDTMHAGTGYMISVSSPNGSPYYYDENNTRWDYDISLTFPSVNTVSKNNLFRPGNVVVDLEENLAEFAHNRSWNFVANPYPAYYDMHCLAEEFTAPVTVWNGSRYVAFSPVDDNLVLGPCQPFFVQRPLIQESIAFGEQGRRHVYSTSGSSGGSKAPALSGEATSREVFNFNFSGEGIEDRARVVINEEASALYEPGRDASLFGGESSFESYVTTADALCSIDERPLGDGQATIGIRSAADTPMTLSLDGRHTAGWGVMLHDNATGITADLTLGDYTFTAMAGDDPARFTVTLRKPADTGVDNLEDALGGDMEVKVTALDGTQVYEGPLGGFTALPGSVYIVSNAKATLKVRF